LWAFGIPFNLWSTRFWRFWADGEEQRYTSTPLSVMKDERPAVQLCSPYESVNRVPSVARRSMLGCGNP
jgi:hypothetical protein